MRIPGNFDKQKTLLLHRKLLKIACISGNQKAKQDNASYTQWQQLLLRSASWINLIISTCNL